MKKQDTVTILKNIISIPSFVDKKNTEAKLAQWIFQMIEQKNIPVIKQQIEGRRFNLLAGNITNPSVLIVGHMDTVKPSSGWKTNPLIPTMKNGKIFGLGASDMKAGLAVMLSTLINARPKNAMFLFYCDEEYDFNGMKSFISKYKNKISLKLIISMDGENLQIGNACRGLIEFTAVVNGKSGHSGNLKSGINAITNSVNAVQELQKWITAYSSSELGKSTTNLASINGGILLSVIPVETGIYRNDNATTSLSSEGNIIPDYCKLVVEVRPAVPNLTVELITKTLTNLLSKRGLKLDKLVTRHNLGSWITPKEQLLAVIELNNNKTLVDPMDAGYQDAQMLWKAFGKVPTCTFGPAEPGSAHSANEFVKVSNIHAAENFLTDYLQRGRSSRGPSSRYSR